MAVKTPSYKWQFKPRFRRNAFGWRSGPAIQRIKEAVSEIKKAARKDEVLAADGAVLFLERVSPALEQVDSSSGAIGTAVNNAIDTLAQIISAAPADTEIRDAWLERLFDAHANDQMPYIEQLAEHWGGLCASRELASKWADQLLNISRHVLNLPQGQYEHFHGTTACLSALYTAERYDDLVELLGSTRSWHYQRWKVKALIAQGKKAEAVRYAQSCKDAWSNAREIDTLCEEALISSGLAEEAYRQYGLNANRANTNLAWFRAVEKKYPHKKPAEILRDLAAHTPCDEGKWFAAAKSAGLYDEAIALAHRSPCSPQTLTRAARDFAEKRPSFALEAGVAALRWLVDGYGYEVTAADVHDAYFATMTAARNCGREQETMNRLCELVSIGEGFLLNVLKSKLGIS